MDFWSRFSSPPRRRKFIHLNYKRLRRWLAALCVCCCDWLAGKPKINFPKWPELIDDSLKTTTSMRSVFPKLYIIVIIFPRSTWTTRTRPMDLNATAAAAVAGQNFVILHQSTFSDGNFCTKNYFIFSKPLWLIHISQRHNYSKDQKILKLLSWLRHKRTLGWAMNALCVANSTWATFL